MLRSNNQIFKSGVLLVATLFYAHTCISQFSYKLKGGLNLAGTGKSVSAHQVSKTGLHAGFGVGYKFKDIGLKLEGELLYTEKGMKDTHAADSRNSMSYPPVFTTLEYDFNYIQLPLIIKHTVLKNFNLGFGGSVSRLIRGSSNVRENYYGDDYTRFDYGFLFDASYQWKKLELGARYDKSVSEIHIILKDDSEFTTTNTLIGVNRVFQFYIAYSFK
jgi:hypothetical protein